MPFFMFDMYPHGASLARVSNFKVNLVPVPKSLPTPAPGTLEQF